MSESAVLLAAEAEVRLDSQAHVMQRKKRENYF